jgi:hypothetical protein
MAEKIFPHLISKYKNNNIIKVPPHSIEAEQALIGGIMINLKSWEKNQQLHR